MKNARIPLKVILFTSSNSAGEVRQIAKKISFSILIWVRELKVFENARGPQT
jgi:hypothetical protein